MQMLLSSAFVAQPSGTVRRLRVRRLGVGRPSQLTAGSKGHRHDCHGHHLNEHHKYRLHYRHDLVAHWFSVARWALSPPKYRSRCFSTYRRAMASGAAPTRGASQPATSASPIGGSSQAPSDAPLVEDAQERRRALDGKLYTMEEFREFLLDTVRDQAAGKLAVVLEPSCTGSCCACGISC